MKLLLHYPEWGNRWIPYIKNSLSVYGSGCKLTVSSTNDREELVKVSKDQDVLLSMWANEIIWFWSCAFPEKKIVTYLRGYELFYDDVFNEIQWDKVNSVIFVNPQARKRFSEKVPNTKTHLIYNGIDLDEFKLSTFAKTGKKIAMICMLRPVKNLPLACQILLELPEDYKIYHIGKVSGMNLGEFEFYLDQLGLKDRFIINGVKTLSGVKSWLVDKDFILSTSIREGNPVSVLEGMAMGLKPVVHRWPGAFEQFEDDYLFYTAKEAANQILDEYINPLLYRNMVEQKFSVSNYNQLHSIISEL